jgi:hypothetical protein
VTAARQAGGAEQVLVAVTTLPPAQLEAKRSFFLGQSEGFFLATMHPPKKWSKRRFCFGGAWWW